VTIERVDKTKIKIVGSTPLKMTDFDVVPPAPRILGMPVIKTGDDIRSASNGSRNTKPNRPRPNSRLVVMSEDHRFRL